jgi:hypothetical protein
LIAFSGQPAFAKGHPHVAFRVPSGGMLKRKKRLEAHRVPTDGPI